MSREDEQLNAILDELIEADIPRAELGAALLSVAGRAGKPIVEKGISKLTERALEAELLQATAGEISEDGTRRLGWKIRIRNHTVNAYAVDTVEIAVGGNAMVSSTTGMQMAVHQPDNLDGRLIILSGEGSCEFWLHTDAGRGREVVPVEIHLRSLEGNRKHELKLKLNRADDLGLKVRQPL